VGSDSRLCDHAQHDCGGWAREGTTTLRVGLPGTF
jgi:hypothetical protein